MQIKQQSDGVICDFGKYLCSWDIINNKVKRYLIVFYRLFYQFFLTDFNYIAGFLRLHYNL